METLTKSFQSAQTVISPAQMLEHWQGHRRLTRRVIEAFPEEELFRFSVADMRSFAQLAQELIDIADRGMRGIVTREWPTLTDCEHRASFNTKAELLEEWDRVTAQIDELWPQIPAGRLQENDLAFGLYEGPVYGTLLYAIDNENHHRGQGYVYLRALNIQPPFFWER